MLSEAKIKGGKGGQSQKISPENRLQKNSNVFLEEASARFSAKEACEQKSANSLRQNEWIFALQNGRMTGVDNSKDFNTAVIEHNYTVLPWDHTIMEESRSLSLRTTKNCYASEADSATHAHDSRVFGEETYELTSGVANFNKLVLWDGGGYAQISALQQMVVRKSSEGKACEYMENKADGSLWKRIPFLGTKSEDIEGWGSLRVSTSIPLAGYNQCFHAVLDGTDAPDVTNRQAMIMGDAEICFDRTKQRMMLSYGYEYWSALGKGHSNDLGNCTAISNEYQKCRISDTRQLPFISYWQRRAD